jgi:hypothetical protein
MCELLWFWFPCGQQELVSSRIRKKIAKSGYEYEGAHWVGHLRDQESEHNHHGISVGVNSKAKVEHFNLRASGL